MNDSEQHNPYASPKSPLVDVIKEKLSSEKYKLFQTVTQTKPLSALMQNFQHYYKELLRIGDTVYISINANIDNIDIPEEYVEDGIIVFDISPKAINNFIWQEDVLVFLATFKSEIIKIRIPFEGLLWIYSNETKTGFDLQNT